jgi:hypothetical protein
LSAQRYLFDARAGADWQVRDWGCLGTPSGRPTRLKVRGRAIAGARSLPFRHAARCGVWHARGPEISHKFSSVYATNAYFLPYLIKAESARSSALSWARPTRFSSSY